MVKVGEVLEVQSNMEHPPFAPILRKQTKGGTNFETQFGMMLEREILKIEKTA